MSVSLQGSGKAVARVWGFAALLYATGLWTMFGHPAVPHASLGDTGDGTIVIALLEHWYRVYAGQVSDWVSPGWYWPAPNALGLTDSMFLLSLPYSLARALGAGWFGANDWTVWTFATLGFWGMVALTRRLAVPVAIGSIAAFVFSFGAVAEFKLIHLQTYTLQLAPWLGVLLVAAWQRWAAWAVMAGLLVGLMFFTAAQTPWFLGLESGFAAVVGFAVAGWRGEWQRIEWRRAGRVALLFCGGLVMGMVPFLLLYRQSFGLVRDYAELQNFAPWLRDPLNIPPGELLWFDLLRQLGIAGRAGRPDGEVALGLTPMFALASVLFLVVPRGSPAIRGLLAAGLLGPLMAINYWGIDPWRLVFYLVPGGSAVRTPFRIELAAQFCLLLGLALGLAALVEGAAWRRAAWLRYAVYGGITVLLGEQLGAPPAGRDTAAMTAWLDAAHRPSFACTAFYLLPHGELTWQEYQSDAMLLSLKIGMPTVNGNGSFFPAHWNFSRTDVPSYPGRVLDWADAHGIREQLCGANPRRGVWVAGVGPLEAKR